MDPQRARTARLEIVFRLREFRVVRRALLVGLSIRRVRCRVPIARLVSLRTRRVIWRACCAQLASSNRVKRMVFTSTLSALRVWTGFRAATPDKLPLIGPMTGLGATHENLWLATGHEGLGITTSLATARLLADQMCGRAPVIPIEPYLPSRSIKEEAHA